MVYQRMHVCLLFLLFFFMNARKHSLSSSSCFDRLTFVQPGASPLLLCAGHRGTVVLGRYEAITAEPSMINTHIVDASMSRKQGVVRLTEDGRVLLRGVSVCFFLLFLLLALFFGF